MDGSFSEDDWDKPSRYGGVGGDREAHLLMWVSLCRDKGAWECDGVADVVPISASGSHGEGCWVGW